MTEYYLIEYERATGGDVLFWRKGASGYTRDLNEAGLFDEEFCKIYLGDAERETFAIEKEEMEKTMKTQLVVCNYWDIMRLKK